MAHLIDDYVAALIAEVKVIGQYDRWPVHTIYFGGGTPSLLSAPQIDHILNALYTHLDITDAAEITLEANPGTVDKAAFKALKASGINRLSIGMQSAHQSELSMFGRWHDFPLVVQAVHDARAAGFDNLSLDLIYGIPNQTREMWTSTLQAAIDLQPDHFSIYALIFESGTEMTRRVKYQELPEPDDDLAADMYDDLTVMMDTAGYPQYEISSWGRPSAHNLQYWRNLPYFGLGAGAHGYVNRTRTVNAMRPEIYIKRMNHTSDELVLPYTPATIKTEFIDDATDMAETLFMGLRMLNEGVLLPAFQQRYGVDLNQEFGEAITKLVTEGFLQLDDDRLLLTTKARLVSNYVFRHFLEWA